MTNPERGEVALTVGGREYTLKLSMNAAAALEKRLGKSVGEILRDAGQLKFTAIRLCVWLLLQKYHADDFKTEESAGNLIDDAGGIAPFFAVLMELGQANRTEGTGDPANPPTAQASTGGGSTSTPDASA